MEELCSMQEKKQAVRFWQNITNGKSVILFSLLLTGCATQKSFSFPERIDFQGKKYEKTRHNQIDKLEQLLYLPNKDDKNLENWQSAILIFLDRNIPIQPLQTRLMWRQQMYIKHPSIHIKLQIKQDELRSEILYPPNERQKNIQLEVTRGQNSNCGYGQVQFSDKRSDFGNNLQNMLASYQQELTKLAQQFAQLPWPIGCQ